VASSYNTIPDFGLLYDSVPLYAARTDVSFYVDEAKAAGGRVLEVGCGTGRILLPIARAGCAITGIDGSKQMLERCRVNLAAEPAAVQSRIMLAQHDMRDSTSPSSSPDHRAVPRRPASHTIDDQLQFLATVARHLAPQGRLVSTSSIPLRHPRGSGRRPSVRIRPSSACPTDARSTCLPDRARALDRSGERGGAVYYVDGKRYVQALEMRWYLARSSATCSCVRGFACARCTATSRAAGGGRVPEIV